MTAMTVPGSATLRSAVAPTLASRVFESLDGTPVAPTSRSAGAAAYLREPVYVNDVTTDDRWARSSRGRARPRIAGGVVGPDSLE
jgi:hypothetical protein